MTPSALIRNWFQKVWNEGDSAAIPEMLATPCEVRGILPSPIKSAMEFQAFQAQFLAALDDIDVKIDSLIEDGDTCGGLFTLRATHRGTRKPIVIRSGFFGKVKDNKIIEADNVVDFLSMLVGIEQVPEDSLQSGLTKGLTE